MSLKLEFVERIARGEKMAPLCREYGISRTAGHKWFKRYKEKRPRTTPLATAEEMVIATLQAREAHPRWGPRKLYDLLRRRFGEATPKVRTIARILKRANLVRERRKRGPTSVNEHAPTVKASTPNEVWTVDFKGWWRVLDGTRCEPLTVRDGASRFLLAMVASSTSCAAVRPVFEQLFRRHGLPGAIQCDNGTPFISVRARAGFSALSAWWTSLDIRVIRSRAGCPQDNGAHERMHADVCAEVQSDPAETLAEQQRLLDRWRQEFNHVRPHEALGGKTPAELYKVTEKRRAPSRPYAYPKRYFVRRVDCNGTFRFRGDACLLGKAFVGLDVGVEVVNPMQVRAWLHTVDLGLVDTLPAVDAACFEPLLPRAPRSKRADTIACKKRMPKLAGGASSLEPLGFST